MFNVLPAARAATAPRAGYPGEVPLVLQCYDGRVSLTQDGGAVGQLPLAPRVSSSCMAGSSPGRLPWMPLWNPLVRTGTRGDES